MPWLIKTRPHYRVVWSCGHVKEQCACTKGNRNQASVTTTVLGIPCLSCREPRARR